MSISNEVKASGLFDRDWYQKKYSDVALSEIRPLKHFVHIGMKINRDPGPNFNTRFYLEQNPEARRAGIPAFLHYLRAGRDKGALACPSDMAASTANTPSEVSPRQDSLHRGPVFRTGLDIAALSGLAPQAKIAVVVNTTNGDDWDAVLDLLPSLAQLHDLFLLGPGGAEASAYPPTTSTVTEISEAGHVEAAAAFGRLAMLNVFDDYQAVLWLSPGEGERGDLTAGIDIAEAFIGDPNWGLYATRVRSIAPDLHESQLATGISTLLSRLGLSLVDRDIAHPEGAAIWLHPLLLRGFSAVMRSTGLDVDTGQWGGVGRAELLGLMSVFAAEAGFATRNQVQPLSASDRGGTDKDRNLKAVAFYLPQFHPIPENDQWWGKGFTDWRNVTRASPLFDHHDQPRVPADFGYYDLRLEETLAVQAELARTSGIHGFCYYYYWFDGKKLLNKPIEQMARSSEIDMGFCVCWANENWTRNWDGQNHHILMEQNYSLESNIALIRELIPMMKDPRWIRHNGKPVMMVYRISIIPNWLETVAAWREECHQAGLGDIHLCAVRFGLETLQGPPGDHGLDSYVLFPPHEAARQNMRDHVSGLVEGFKGQIFDYSTVVNSDLDTFSTGSDESTHRGAMLGWDNTARRQTEARIFLGATPFGFRRWIKGILEQEIRHNPEPESLIFINAWNEWAEGTYLEPDQRWGKSYLKAFGSAMDSVPGVKISLLPEGVSDYDTNAPDLASKPARDPAQRHPDAALLDDAFDTEFYLSRFAPDQRPGDPVSHYLNEGGKQGWDPTPWFSTYQYLALHPDVAAAGMNPFVHYILAGEAEGRQLSFLDGEVSSLYKAHEFAVTPGPLFEEVDPAIGHGQEKRAKVLAYYLPQFHPIEENDVNWGVGFTEWRNLPRALPRFEGHIQPKIPRDLGPYDLSESDVMRRQITMAKDAGLYGFCFYYYWFDGKRVLETPTEALLSDPSLDFPFTLMWANENWTRTWDGHDSDIILQQNYRPEDDEAFIDDLQRHFADPRYIKVQGRPLYFIYRPGQIPDAVETIARWRALFKERHGTEPLMFMAQGFGDLDPRAYGLDGAIEFPPHKLCQNLPNISPQLKMLDPGYAGVVQSYDTVIERSIAETTTDFPLIRTVVPQWDNEARRPGRGMVLYGSTPQKFEKWLSEMFGYARENPCFGESFVCVNSWNEWAEGAQLEPDVHYGAAYLNALSRAVHAPAAPVEIGSSPTKVLIVGHDAHRNGAQLLALNIGRTLARQMGAEVAFLLCDDGPLVSEYETIGRVYLSTGDSEDRRALVHKLRDEGFKLAITNTTPSGITVPALKDAGFSVVSLIHELPNLLRSYHLESQAGEIASRSDHVIFPAKIVKDGFEGLAGAIQNQAEIFPQGLYDTSVQDIGPGDHGVRAELGLSKDTRIVLGVGYADIRKGIDRFINAALSICSQDPNVAFLWVGNPAGETIDWFVPEIDTSGLGSRIRILGHRDDAARFFAASDIYYMSSREDPFPSVVLEALAAGLPIVGHQDTGGSDDLIRRHGRLVSSQNPVSAVEVIVGLLEALDGADGQDVKARRAEIEQNYSFSSYVFGLLQRLKPDIGSVSVVLPNYNYQDHIGDRLRTIFHQSLPVLEVLVLDDASTDDSVAEIKHVVAAQSRAITLRVNATNSGSPFPQWRKGVQMAKGDYVWIAEADDLAKPEFLERIVTRMQETGAVLGFCDSWTLDEHDVRTGDSYVPYIDSIEPGTFTRDFEMDGRDFLARYLAIKNVILNVSGVVFRRDALLAAMDKVGKDLDSYGVAGDWCLYVEICAAGGRVVFEAASLNGHRRHSTSVTHSLKVEKHLAEIDEMHQMCRDRAEISAEVMKAQEKHMKDCRRHLGVE